MITLDERPDSWDREELERLYREAIEAVRAFSSCSLSCCCIRTGMNAEVYPQMYEALKHIYRMNGMEDEIIEGEVQDEVPEGDLATMGLNN